LIYCVIEKILIVIETRFVAIILKTYYQDIIIVWMKSTYVMDSKNELPTSTQTKESVLNSSGSLLIRKSWRLCYQERNILLHEH